ncbi:NAD-dependent epimerase/dehydratase family protein [Salinifilum aidingensis]
MAPNVVLVTGVSRFLGGHVAARLAAEPAVDRVVGVDGERPSRDMARRMGRTEFVRADIRNPAIAQVIERHDVDTVVHTALNTQHAGSARSASKEMNVLGTMQLLAACQQAPRLRKLVLRSTAAVYGISPRDPAVFTEDMEPKDVPSSGYAKDAVEIEGYVRGFARRRPDVAISTLRFTDVIGPRVDATLPRYFAQPVVPVVCGYDARLQLLHSDDAVAVLQRAALTDLPGVFNVAGQGVLMLSQAIQRAGRVAVPVPRTAVPALHTLLRGANPGFDSEQLRYLAFGRVVDTTRLREHFGYTPRWGTGEAFDDYVRGRELRRLVDDDQVRWVERALGAALSRVAGGRAGGDRSASTRTTGIRATDTREG